jgi:hypothetical protein
MDRKKLKKADFIRFSDNPSLNFSIIKMLKQNWSDILKNPDVMNTDSFTKKELESLACMNMEIFTKTAVATDNRIHYKEDPLTIVLASMLGKVKSELKSLMRE